MSIEAMKQGLEALERSVSTCFDRRAYEDVMSRPEHFINQTITALRTAIAGAESVEPVAWNLGVPPLHPQINADETFSVEYVDTTPPAAQRQPLTEEEVLRLWAGDISRPVLGKNKVLAFARAIEAAHGITGEKK